MSDFKTQADIERYLLEKEGNKIINITGAIVFYQNGIKIVTNKLGLESNKFTQNFSGYFNPDFWSKYTPPQLIIVNGVECPAPLTSIVGLEIAYIAGSGDWNDKIRKVDLIHNRSDYIKQLLNDGVLYATEQGALLRYQAMIITHPRLL